MCGNKEIKFNLMARFKIRDSKTNFGLIMIVLLYVGHSSSYNRYAITCEGVYASRYFVINSPFYGNGTCAWKNIGAGL